MHFGFALKILHILDKQPDAGRGAVAGGGGLAIHVENLCEQLKANGHASPVLRLVVDDTTGKNIAATREDEYTLRSSYGLIQGYRLKFELRKLLDDIKPDIVHVHGCFTSLSPVLMSMLQDLFPVIGTLHDIRPFCYVMSRRFAPDGNLCERRCGIGCFTTQCVRPRDATDILRLARRWFVDASTLSGWKTLDRVIAPSEYIRNLARQHGIKNENLRLVPHGIELPTRTARSARSNHETPIIMYLGSLFEEKGVLHLIKALQLLQHPAWRAIFVGSGPLHNQIAQYLHRGGIADRVEIRDHISQRDEIYELLASARMLVVPSTIPESFALVGIEALAVGTPVVSFALGGITEWFRDGENGLAAADLDCNDLARQIDKLLKSPQLADELGSFGRTLVETSFNRAKAFEHTFGVYQELAD